MRVRGVELRAGDVFLGAIVVEPLLTRLEAHDNGVTRSGIVFRRMLSRRTITAADVTAFGASAKMQPPSAPRQAFDASCPARLGRRIDTIPFGPHGFLLAVRDTWVALPNFYDVAV